jgi:hypothetical protein
MTTRYGQMAAARVIGPMGGFPTVTGRRPLPLEAIRTPNPVYWPAAATGVTRTPSQTGAIGLPPTAPNGGPCCGQ